MITTTPHQRPEQVRFTDSDGDQLLVDKIEEVTVFTVHAADDRWLGVELSPEDVAALVRHVAADVIATLVADLDKADDDTRPVGVSDEDWDRDDEEGEAVADAYFHAANLVRNAFGVPRYTEAEFAALTEVAEEILAQPGEAFTVVAELEYDGATDTLSEAEVIARATGSASATVTHDHRDPATGALVIDSTDTYERKAL